MRARTKLALALLGGAVMVANGAFSIAAGSAFVGVVAIAVVLAWGAVYLAFQHECRPTETRHSCWCGQRWVPVLVIGRGYRWMRAEQEAR